MLSDKSSKYPLETSWSLCLHWKVGRKGPEQLIQISEELEKLRSREELKKAQELEFVRIRGNSSCCHHLFSKFLHLWNFFYTPTHSCLLISFSLWHGMAPAQGHKTFPVVSTFLEFWVSPFKRMSLNFPIFSMTPIELVVDAHRNNFWYPSTVLVST